VRKKNLVLGITMDKTMNEERSSTRLKISAQHCVKKGRYMFGSKPEEGRDAEPFRLWLSGYMYSTLLRRHIEESERAPKSKHNTWSLPRLAVFDGGFPESSWT
jgi:hypothetical protein